MAELELIGVEKTFPARAPAGAFRLGPLDLTVPDGRLTVLVGPSGCGKTTTLRLLAGLDAPTAGTIRIGGRSVAGVSPRGRDVAMVFQDHALYPQMTVAANLAFPLKMRRLGRTEIRNSVRQTAQLVEIERLLDRVPAELSGGQLQRVALGRAIIRRPKVSLFDEPLAHLDPPARSELRRMLVDLQQKLGLTVLYVTHDQTEATALGQSLVVLNNGRIEQVGTPEAVYETPASRFVAAFFGSPGMNFLDGTLERTSDRWHFVTSGGLHVSLEPRRGAAASPPRTATLGIRPRDLEVARPAGGPRRGETFRAVVASVGLCDGRRLARLELGGESLQAELPPGTLFARGDDVEVRLPAERVFLFDSSGRNANAAEG